MPHLGRGFPRLSRHIIKAKSSDKVKIAERRSILIVMDFIGVNAAVLFSLALRPEYRLDPELIFKHPHWFLILLAVWFPLAYAFDCYDPKILGRFLETAKARIKTGLVASFIYLLIPFLTPALPSSRLLFLSLPLFLVMLTVAVSGIYDLAHGRPFFLQRTLVIGAGREGKEIAGVLREQGGGVYDIGGFVDDDPAKKDAVVDGIMVLGDRHALLDLIRKNQIKILILAVKREVNGEFLQILTDCLELGVEIVPMPRQAPVGYYQKADGYCVGNFGTYMFGFGDAFHCCGNIYRFSRADFLYADTGGEERACF
jgi:FlaA1/EpsC-like NDP-sugar epimerase